MANRFLLGKCTENRPVISLSGAYFSPTITLCSVPFLMRSSCLQIVSIYKMRQQKSVKNINSLNQDAVIYLRPRQLKFQACPRAWSLQNRIFWMGSCEDQAKQTGIVGIYIVWCIIVRDHAFCVALQAKPSWIRCKVQLGICRGLEFHVTSVLSLGFISIIDQLAGKVNLLDLISLELRPIGVFI